VSYEDKIANHREEIHDFMKDNSDSPLPDSIKSNFRTLDYFGPDPEFKVKASLELIDNDPVINMATSDGETRRYTRYAYARFELKGQLYQLTLLKPMEDKSSQGLFLPFGDSTNGDETYGGGRYLDLESTDKSSITIDFNLAYNPYCVYSTAYSCPLPPAENQLTVAISAGEKNFLPVN
jgi:uncharacterized protein (DUF1684 family)